VEASLRGMALDQLCKARDWDRDLSSVHRRLKEASVAPEAWKCCRMATSAERYVIAKPGGSLVADIYGQQAEFTSREEADGQSALEIV
jgi:hypothetical protein